MLVRRARSNGFRQGGATPADRAGQRRRVLDAAGNAARFAIGSGVTTYAGGVESHRAVTG
jgi:hypothetical protein